MKIPDEPKDGFSVSKKISEIIRWVRGERIVSVVGGRLEESPNGKSLIIDSKDTKTTRQLLPFQIYGGGSLTPTQNTFITAAPGILDGEEFAATTENNPADGTWYCYAAVEIDADTGENVSRSVFWTTTAQTNDSTNFYSLIGTIVVGDDRPVPSSIVQFNYGPIYATLVGAYGNDVWEVFLA